MREELQQTKSKLEQAQSELSAWKFTPDRYKLVFHQKLSVATEFFTFLMFCCVPMVADKSV